YDVSILYHPGKANIVADALSRKVEVVAESYSVDRSSTVMPHGLGLTIKLVIGKFQDNVIQQNTRPFLVKSEARNDNMIDGS
ncbi:hypothetical protein HAX54_022941, partial [Datura stramonium]|nr:hypothetical protein [Datura stramonium]